MKILLLETKKTGETKTLAGKSFPLRVEKCCLAQHLKKSPHRDAVMPGLRASFA